MLDTATIKAVVFDLDNTLLDHSAAEKQAITRFLAAYHDAPMIGEMVRAGEAANFIAVYRHWNERLWTDLAFKRITSEDLRWQRFARTLTECMPLLSEADAERLGRDMGTTYLQLYRDGWQVIDGADEMTKRLRTRFKTGIITNGFRDQQRGKLAHAGWENRFDAVLLSDELGVMKPHKEIFDRAATELSILPHEAVYVGDNYATDIEGAARAGWQTVWYNPASHTPSRSMPASYAAELSAAGAIIRSLSELEPLLLS